MSSLRASNAVPSLEPSVVLAGIFLGLFSLTSLLHSFQAIKTRTWFLLPLLIGSYCEVAAFAVRMIMASSYPDLSVVPTLLSTLLPLIAPTLVISSLFVELGYIMRMCKAEKLSLIRPTILTVLLLVKNGLVFLAQTIGAVLATIEARSVQTAMMARYLSIGAIAVQLALLLFFLANIFVFDMRYVGRSRQMRFNERLPWERHVKALYFCSAMLVLRCIVHLIVYNAGHSSSVFALLTSSEWPIYAFDAGPLVLALITLNWVHPSEISSSLKHRGLICMRLFHYEKPMPPAKFTSLEPPERAGFKTRIGTLSPELTESMVQLLPASRPQSRPGSRTGSRAHSRTATKTSISTIPWAVAPSMHGSIHDSSTNNGSSINGGGGSINRGSLNGNSTGGYSDGSSLLLNGGNNRYYHSRTPSHSHSHSHHRSPSFISISRPSSRATSRATSRPSSRPSSISVSRMSWQTMGGSTVGESLWVGGEHDTPPLMLPTLFPSRAASTLQYMPAEMEVPPVPPVPKIVYSRPHPDLAGPHYVSPAYR